MNAAGLKNLQSKRARRNIKISKTSNTTNGIPSLLWNGVSGDMSVVGEKTAIKPVQKKTENTYSVNSAYKERLIVTFTSWKKRIHNCSHIVDLIKRQTLKPYKIVLNLSSDEFVNKENDLPIDLLDKRDGIFEIFWVKENTKVYKKIIPTLDRFPNDLIVCIDDDIEYPNNAIDILYKKYLTTNRRNPVTAGTWDWEGGIHSHLGCLTMFSKEMFGPYLKDLYENVVMKQGIDKIPFDDAIFTYSVLLNNRRYIGVDGISGVSLVRVSHEHKQNRLFDRKNNDYHLALNTEHYIIRNYILSRYHKTYSDLVNPVHMENYTSSGKTYNNEKAIISLTSWKKRINTVYKTIDNLLSMCPGFHIVLVLSEEEFPKKENELPLELMRFVNSNRIELLWVYKNYKAFKKVLFTMDKYRDVPVISADDDCIYLRNYAQEFYDKWLNNKNCFISCWGKKYKNFDNGYTINTAGAATLYPPFVFKEIGIKNLSEDLLKLTNQDDLYYLCLKMKLKLNNAVINGSHRTTYKFHNEEEPIRNEYKVLNMDEKYKLIKKVYSGLKII